MMISIVVEDPFRLKSLGLGELRLLSKGRFGYIAIIRKSVSRMRKELRSVSK